MGVLVNQLWLRQYVNQLKNFVSRRKKNSICSYKEGLDIVKIAEKIKKH